MFALKRFAMLASAACILHGAASADPIPAGWTAENVKPIGYNDHRDGASKLAIKQSGGHWYLFKASDAGFSIYDVTDPTDPQYLKTVVGPKNTMLGQVSVHDNLLVTGINRPITDEEAAGKADGWTILQPSSAEKKDFQEGILIWDISDPTNPKPLSHWEGHALGTHRNSYPGGKYAFLSSTMPGYRGFILVILDVSDPRHPKEAGRWWYPGQKEGEPVGKVTPSFHGPANLSPDGKMISLGYTPSVINLDITDIAHPKLIGELPLIPPFANTATQSIHTVVPLWDRKLLFASGEPMRRNCKEGLTGAVFIDNSDPKNPQLLSVFPTPRPAPGAPYKNFCDKGGRFGPHNVNTEIHSPDVQPIGDLIYMAYFTAGLRVFDIKDARLPTEVGWFLPPSPTKSVQSQGGALVSNATQDVLVDTRGNIYVSDSAWGVWIVRYAGPFS